MKYIKGPDFPTGGIIYGIKGIENSFERGQGRITLCSKYPKLVVFSVFISKKLVMRTELYNATSIENGDSVAETARGKTMADVDRGLITNDVIEI